MSYLRMLKYANFNKINTRMQVRGILDEPLSVISCCPTRGNAARVIAPDADIFLDEWSAHGPFQPITGRRSGRYLNIGADRRVAGRVVALAP